MTAFDESGAGGTLALGGIVGPALFVASWVAAGMLRNGYSPVHDAISRLAERDAPHRWIVTSGMVAFAIGAGLLATAMATDRRLRAAAAAVAVAGASAFAVALFPCTQGCPGPGRFTDDAHTLAAGIHYVSLTAAPLVAAWAFRRDRPGFAAFCTAAGSIAGMSLVAQTAGLGANGLLQRIGLTTDDVWMGMTAFPLLGRRSV
ncbi:MAG: DUF998 domain-containing protein [Actinomycetota bacterium]